MTVEIWDLIPEQERLSNKNIDRICKILDKNDINISRHSLKSWPPGGNPVDPEKENKQYSDHLGAKKESNDESSESIKIMFSIWQWQRKKLLEYKQMNEHSDHCWGQYCSKTVCDLVNFSSTWWATLHLKDIFILGYPLKHSYDSRQMLYVAAFEWMLEGCTHKDWLWDHLFWSSNAHFTAWIWVITWTSLMMQMHFFSWSDLTSWEESMKKNIKLTTTSLLLQAMRCMSGWLDSSWRLMITYLKGMFQLEASSWLIDHLDGC
jgi:hypothetical protein